MKYVVSFECVRCPHMMFLIVTCHTESIIFKGKELSPCGDSTLHIQIKHFTINRGLSE